jgi:hypothetical protein
LWRAIDFRIVFSSRRASKVFSVRLYPAEIHPRGFSVKKSHKSNRSAVYTNTENASGGSLSISDETVEALGSQPFSFLAFCKFSQTAPEPSPAKPLVVERCRRPMRVCQSHTMGRIARTVLAVRIARKVTRVACAVRNRKEIQAS